MLQRLIDDAGNLREAVHGCRDQVAMGSRDDCAFLNAVFEREESLLAAFSKLRCALAGLFLGQARFDLYRQA